MLFRDLQPWFRPYAQALYQAAGAYGLQPRITSVYRSRTEQARLYQNWVNGRSRLPAAAPGRSLHQYGRAFDMTVMRGNAEVGVAWESVGGRWGGRFNDPVHYDTGW